jgi:Fic family protein
MRRIGPYLHQKPDWPIFTWDQAGLADKLAATRHRQGLLLGRMNGLGFALQRTAALDGLALEIVKSSEIEGEMLPADQVRSSVARRLGIDAAGLPSPERRVEGVVDMTLDAVGSYAEPLTVERLFRWHASLFAADDGTLTTGAWRNDSKGPMRVVSGAMGRERVHFEAPAAARIAAEMRAFLAWENRPSNADPVMRAALTHLWFVTIHPFEDGNGRLARALADRALARADGDARRFYSMSAQIRVERKAYYEVLEKTQRGPLDVTEWMSWFLDCLGRAFAASEDSLAAVLRRGRFWQEHAGKSINPRQRLVLDRLFQGFVGKLTTTKWSTLADCSQDTAHRDIVGLVELGMLVQDEGGGRSTSYSLPLTKP